MSAPGKQRILAVFAHPDDAELSCFGTLAALCDAGHDVHVVTLTNGANSVSPHSADRTREAIASAALVGVELTVGAHLDGAIALTGSTYAFVRAHLTRIRPDVVVTHYTNPTFLDDHQDHQVTGRIALTLAKRDAAVRLILQAEPPVVISAFQPDVYIDITESMPKKLAALAQYQSESMKPYMEEDFVQARARFWGLQAKLFDTDPDSYYEAFQLVRARYSDPTRLFPL
ncbi:PIG-L family deacetylase [Asanoa sp. WMMD1127]|uniref:PIG-L deacetylase family protein n=1 Tax=Asanoa sp. WMMD1127 TaxID=3016107 RepID=UPI002416E4C7|nr:PIG-L deacetylase family protein [Asanoa sp. WMMD1127]MDG4820747.1 PIG-L family deacetylase [Asanoa sp. WMMD1127]